MAKVFKAMQKMVDNNMDIQLSTTMLEINKHPQGAVLKVGVDAGCINKLASNEYMFCLLVVNKKELKDVQESEVDNE